NKEQTQGCNYDSCEPGVDLQQMFDSESHRVAQLSDKSLQSCKMLVKTEGSITKHVRKMHARKKKSHRVSISAVIRIDVACGRINAPHSVIQEKRAAVKVKPAQHNRKLRQFFMWVVFLVLM